MVYATLIGMELYRGRGTRMGNNGSTPTQRFRHPSTPHAPWSHSATPDDRHLASMDHFHGREVVQTSKMDGEATVMARDYIHARSPDAKDRSDTMRRSRAWVRALHGQIAHDIPVGHRIGGENVFAVHSLEYDQLPTYFFVYVWWDEHNNALSWDDTKEWCDLLGLQTVPELYRGIYDEEQIKQQQFTPVYGQEAEGCVIRTANGFSFDDFGKNVAKVVRPNHVQTDQHWSNSALQINHLAQP